jgi:ketosteroid isomerase-like protein
MLRRYLIYGLLLTTFFLQMAPHATAMGPKHNQLKKRDYKREISGLEEQWRVAQIAGDVNAMERLLSDDYVGITMNGMVNTKTQQLDRIRSKAFVLSKMDLSDDKIRIIGTVAIVTCKAEVQGTNEGMPISGAYRYTRVYQRLPSGDWKITNFEVTRVPRARHTPESTAEAPANPTI